MIGLSTPSLRIDLLIERKTTDGYKCEEIQRGFK
jgi:hypothetical protein